MAMACPKPWWKKSSRWSRAVRIFLAPLLKMRAQAAPHGRRCPGDVVRGEAAGGIVSHRDDGWKWEDVGCGFLQLLPQPCGEWVAGCRAARMGKLGAEVRWVLGRDRGWSHWSLPQLERMQRGTQSTRAARHGWGGMAVGLYVGIRDGTEVPFLAAVPTCIDEFGLGRDAFPSPRLSHWWRKTADCRWWLQQSKVSGRTEMQENRLLFPTNAEG